MVLCIPESTSAVVPDGGGNCINVSTALVGNFLRNPNLGWDIENTNLFVNEVVYLDDSFFEDLNQTDTLGLSGYFNRTLDEVKTKLDSQIFNVFGATGQENRILLEDPDTTIVYYLNLNLPVHARFDSDGANADDLYELANTSGTDLSIPDITNIASRKLSLYRLFENFFGPRHTSNLYGQSDAFYSEGRTFDDSYHILSELIPDLCRSIQIRLQALFDRFPNHRIACYIGHRQNEDSPNGFGQGDQQFDEAGIIRYDDSDQTHFNIGARNCILYTNRLGVYNDPSSVHYIDPSDNGPEIVKSMFIDSNNPSRRAELLTNFYLKGDDSFAAGGDNQVYLNKVIHSQIHDALSFNELNVTTTTGSGQVTVSLVDTFKPGGQSFIDTIHLAASFDNQPFTVDRLLNRDIINLVSTRLCELIKFRNTPFNDVYFWSESEAENVGIFLPEFGIFPVLVPLPGGGTNVGGPTSALFNLDLFNVSGCELPPLPLPQDKIQVIKDIITGEAFRSPVEQAVNTVIGVAGDFAEGVATAISSGPRAELGAFTDENGNTQVHTVTTYLTDVTSQITEISEEFQSHAYRLSGVSNYKDGFESGGSIGDLPGLTGLQAIAQNYNNLKNSIDAGTIGEDLVDHYSPFFGSILGPGDQLYESLNTLLDGDIRNFITQFPIEDDRFDFSEATVQQMNELKALGEQAFALKDSIRNLIDQDNITYFAALDYMSKSTLGFSVLSMVEDPCFSQKLLGQIAKPDLKGLLNI